MAKPPARRRNGLGILAGAILMFVAGGVSAWMYRGESPSSNQALVCDPTVQTAAAPSPTESAAVPSASTTPVASTEILPAAEPQSEAARIVSAYSAIESAANATPQNNHTAAVTSKPATTVKSAAAPAAKSAVKPSTRTASSASGKTKQAKSKSNTAVAKAKPNDKKTDVAKVDPDVDVIEALLRHGDATGDSTASNVRSSETKARKTGS